MTASLDHFYNQLFTMVKTMAELLLIISVFLLAITIMLQLFGAFENIFFLTLELPEIKSCFSTPIWKIKN